MNILKLLLLLTPLSYLTETTMDVWDAKMFFISAIAVGAGIGKRIFLKGLVKEDFITQGLFGVILLNIFLHNFDISCIVSGVNILLGVFIALSVSQCENPRELGKWIVAAGLVNVFVLLFQKLGYNPILTTTPMDYPGGIFGNMPRFTSYLCVILPFIWEFSIPVALLASVVPLLGDSQNTVILALFIILFFKYGKYTKILVIPLFAGACFWKWGEILNSLTVRWTGAGDSYQGWSNILIGFFQHPLKGYGLGTDPMVPDNIKFDPVMYSSLLLFIVRTGVCGLAWVLFTLKRFKESFNPTPAGLSILIFIALSCVEYPFEMKRLWFTLFTIIGIFLSDPCNPSEDPDKPVINSREPPVPKLVKTILHDQI